MDAAKNTQSEIVVDVREDLRQGREPFQKIMRAADEVPAGGTLILFATFKPTPLLAVMRSQGFEGQAEPIEGGDWRVVFRRTAGGDAGGPGGGAPGGAPAATKAEIVELDNRGLEPPEPMIRTLEAINRLAPGGRITGRYDRRPMFLLPKLEEMGFRYEVTQNDDGSVTVDIFSPAT